LAHIPGLFSVINDGMVTPILVGAFSFLIAISKAWNKGLEEKKHSATLKEKRLDPKYLEKQYKLQQFNQRISDLKNSLPEKVRAIASKIQNLEKQQKYIDEINALIEKSPKKWTREKNKNTIFLTFRGILKVSIDISSVILIARAVLTMGFLR